MAISIKTTKLLWARSANKCAICKCGLTLNSLDKNHIIGEQCHIISSKINGPRNDVKQLEDYDDYENIILLCPNHHSIIDSDNKKYTFELLLLLKGSHEQWLHKH